MEGEIRVECSLEQSDYGEAKLRIISTFRSKPDLAVLLKMTDYEVTLVQGDSAIIYLPCDDFSLTNDAITATAHLANVTVGEKPRYPG